ncbi:MAG TPA: glycoside hydrolase family 15 protein, partial [Anaerolineales bacterium]|nr:glycoside hydrolase family 15 protein [Anaerolineales bacterium]
MFRHWSWLYRVMRLLTTGFAALLFVVQFLPSLHVAALPALSAASDGPGSLSHYDLARKDCAGTARNTGSKVWFTVANGVLSDVYYPTIDNTNVETLQYAVTDGSTFTDLQTRDMTYTVQPLSGDPQAMDCRVTATARSGKYRLVSDYLTDPEHNSVVIRSRFTALVGDQSNYKLYVLYNPSINGNGGGGADNGGGDNGVVDTSTKHSLPVAFDTNTASQAVNRTYAVPVYSALDSSSPFIKVSNGFVGQPSDGLVQLDATHQLTSTFTQADNGNLEQVAQINPSRDGNFVLALGLGTSRKDAVRAAEDSLHTGFNSIQKRYESGWAEYDERLKRPPHSFPNVPNSEWRQLVNEYYLSANIVKASEDKTFPGAIVAGLASPWGQAISAGDPNNLFFGSYREVFSRDAYEAWTALLLDGDTATARNVVNFLFNRQQQASGALPRNSLLNGETAPDSFGVQLDEVSYPILMAYQLGMTDHKLYQDHIKLAANGIIAHGPASGPERWEEQDGFSPSTISAEIAGLVAAASIAQKNGDFKSAQIWLGVADDWQRSLEGWTVTTNGPLSGSPYFIRLSKTGDPNAAITYNLGNGGPTLDQRTVIDAGFLELVRLGLVPANDPAVVQSLPVVDATIKTDTPSGPGWHRYNGDGYGDGASDGHPWAPSGAGTGHVWPPLTEERGEYDIASGQRDTAAMLLATMDNFASGVGLIPEQDWELPDLAASPFGTDSSVASIGFQDGHPAGSAAPLTWSAGAYVRLMLDLAADSILEQPRNTYGRYIAHQQGQTSLTVTSPADSSAASGSPVTVTGTTAPGNTVYVAGTNIDNNSATSVVSAPVNPDGSFSLVLPI